MLSKRQKIIIETNEEISYSYHYNVRSLVAKKLNNTFDELEMILKSKWKHVFKSIIKDRIKKMDLT